MTTMPASSAAASSRISRAGRPTRRRARSGASPCRAASDGARRWRSRRWRGPASRPPRRCRRRRLRSRAWEWRTRAARAPRRRVALPAAPRCRAAGGRAPPACRARAWGRRRPASGPPSSRAGSLTSSSGAGHSRIRCQSEPVNSVRSMRLWCTLCLTTRSGRVAATRASTISWNGVPHSASPIAATPASAACFEYRSSTWWCEAMTESWNSCSVAVGGEK
jgi:hypothetical protein